MLNKVMLIGNLGGEPELRNTTSGTPVTNFSVATSRSWKDKSTGETNKDTEWHKVVVWGKQAEIAVKYLAKGKLVYIEGRLQTRSWEDKRGGEKKWITEIVCESFRMLSKSERNTNQGTQSGSSSYSGDSEDGEDIPF